MRQILFLSGKGGTGKTSLAAAFAVLLTEDKILADCDVDAANLHLLLDPKTIDTGEFTGFDTGTATRTGSRIDLRQLLIN